MLPAFPMPMWLLFAAATTLTPPTLFQQRSDWVRHSMLIVRMRDDNDARTLSQADLMDRAMLRGSRDAIPAYSALGVAIFASLTVLIAHGPGALRGAGVGPASLPDGAMGGGWGLRF